MTATTTTTKILTTTTNWKAAAATTTVGRHQTGRRRCRVSGFVEITRFSACLIVSARCMIQKRAVTGNGVQLVADVELLFCWRRCHVSVSVVSAAHLLHLPLRA